MPFGKFRGEQLDRIPRQYLEWLKDHIPLRDPLKTEVYRQTLSLAVQDDGISVLQVQSVYHQLARKYHPDLGGNTIAMQAVNEFRDKLVQRARD